VFFRYGSYQHASGEVNLTITKESVRSPRGTQDLERITYALAGVLILADGATQADYDAAIATLEAAYAVDGQNAGLYLDSGAPTQHILYSANALGGVRVMRPPSFPRGEKGEFATMRSYTIQLQADFLDNSAGNLKEYAETIRFIGTGGPRFVIQQPMNGQPVKQFVSDQTPCRAVQSGNAVGRFQVPGFPGPIWPDAEHQDLREISPSAPKFINGAYTDWGVSWSYHFEDVAPLTGQPTQM
jgi:hypothetical protein